MSQTTLEKPTTRLPRVGTKLLTRILPSAASLRKSLPATGKSLAITLASMGLFLLVWQLSAAYLYNVEANSRINRVLEEQGADAAAQMRDCIASGDISCKPNTLPSPSEVVSAAQVLMADHRTISADKKAFAEKTAGVNAQRIAAGQAPITYTGRPSFVDQIMTSLKTVAVGFLIALLIAIPIGIIIGLNESLYSSPSRR